MKIFPNPIAINQRTEQIEINHLKVNGQLPQGET